MSVRLFDRGDLEAVDAALGIAEELTGRFYCIPGREWPRYPYDLRTRAEDPGPTGAAFAEVVRVVTSAAMGPSDGFPERFRIRLRDDTILAAVHDRDDGVELYPLLLYVLTHELVHVVRFGAGFAEFEAATEDRWVEEDRVHGITRKILDPVGTPELGLVARLYGTSSASGVCSPK